VLFSHGRNKSVLVPDSFRATERNGKSVSVDFTYLQDISETIRSTLVSYIVGNSIHCNLFVRVLEAGSKASFWRAFLVCIAASAN
jgi:hypothetical protein